MKESLDLNCHFSNHRISSFCSDKFSPDKCSNITNLRHTYPNNPLQSFLNIKSLKNKIIDLRECFRSFSPDYFVLAKTKLKESFPSSQYFVEMYEI